MYKKYVRLLFLIVASMMYVGCSEEPFDWSGDSERPVPVPVNLSLEAIEDIVSAACNIEHHDDDLPIIEAGFFYGDNENVTYKTGKHVKTDFGTEGFSYGRIPCYGKSGNDVFYCYVGAYITTSRGTVTIGPEYTEYSW